MRLGHQYQIQHQLLEKELLDESLDYFLPVNVQSLFLARHKFAGENILVSKLECFQAVLVLRIQYHLLQEAVSPPRCKETMLFPIDNDLQGTDYTFGFDTAVHIATEAIDRIHTTAESHHRIMVIEVMGRHTGWIATVAGLAGGADCILIPEQPMTIQEVAETIRKRHSTGKTFSIVVVAEGFMPTGMDVKYEKEKTDDFDHTRLGGIGNLIGQKLEELTNIDTRVTILGHVQRGGTPTAYDRVLATRFGVKAVDMVVNGEFGKMAALKGSEIVPVSLEEVAKGRKTVNMELYEIAKVFFG